jgi:hypothetical protein
MLPIALASSLGSPPTDNIAFWLIGLFVVSIGLPFAALATTAPLLQSWFAASGRATLYSYVIHHRPAPGFTPPYSIAVVELAEGPRMMTNIVECPQTPEALQLDMALEVAFEKIDDEITLPLFRPAKG